jgi:hypothetical protein
MGYSLKLDYRLIFLKYLFLILSIVFITDLALNSGLITFISLKMIFPQAIQPPQVSYVITNEHNPLFIFAVIGSLTIFTILYFLIKKRNIQYITIGYNLFFFLILLMLVTGIWYKLSYFFSPESLLYSSMNLFAVDEWYIGWFILLIIMCALSAHIISGTMMILRNKFLHFNFGLHYILEFNRITILSLYGLTAICFLPDILIYWFQ